jgi:hypothetical protein
MLYRTLQRVIAACLLALAAALPASAQQAAFKAEELESLTAPIALYPDALVAQILMASTYPLEVVEAARWSKANPGIKEKELENAMQQQKWDPSVKSLTAFPQVLQGMSEKLELTQKLGDAFLAQQKDVMDAIQRLRKKAQAAGNLKSTKEQAVTTEQKGGTTIVKVEPASPSVVYVPTYDPMVVYGPWPYPAYPPYYWYPYPPGAVAFSFTVGIFVGSALWGGCNWGGGGVYINHRSYNEFNRTNINTGDWQHRPEHRKGVEYRDNASRDKYRPEQRASVDSREAFRGRAEQGQRDIARDLDSGRRQDAFQGMDRGREARDFSSRGASSRASSFQGGARGGMGGAGRGGRR